MELIILGAVPIVLVSCLFYLFDTCLADVVLVFVHQCGLRSEKVDVLRHFVGELAEVQRAVVTHFTYLPDLPFQILEDKHGLGIIIDIS